MHRRDLVSLSALALAALTLAPGAPRSPRGPPAARRRRPRRVAPAASAEKPSAAPQAAEAPKATGQAAAPAAPEGKGTIKGVVKLHRQGPRDEGPGRSARTPSLQDKEVKYNAVVVNDGKLKDTFVRIANGGVKGSWTAPDDARGDRPGGLHVHAPHPGRGRRPGDRHQEQRRDAPQRAHLQGLRDLVQPGPAQGRRAAHEGVENDGIIKFTCDVHPWMRGFVVVTDHPFFAVSGDDGSFTIEKVPAGKYNVEAWHSHYGLKKAAVESRTTSPPRSRSRTTAPSLSPPRTRTSSRAFGEVQWQRLPQAVAPGAARPAWSASWNVPSPGSSTRRRDGRARRDGCRRRLVA